MDVSNAHASGFDASPAEIPVLNPADRRRVVGVVPAQTSAVARAAATEARRAGAAWQSLGPIARSRVLIDTARLVRSRADELADLISDECGKTTMEAAGEVEKTADFFDYYSAIGRLSQGDVLPEARLGARAWTVQEPVGVVLAVTPFNDPLITPARKVAPALITGNSVLLKPAPATPLIAGRLREVLEEAGLPTGTLTTLTGSPEEVVTPLLNPRLIDALTFTGSTSVGRQLEKALAGSGVRVQLELGGNNTAVVMPDADLPTAARHIAAAAFGQSGQRCTATSRVLAHHLVADQLLDQLCERMDLLVQGRAGDRRATLGPLIDERPAVAAHRAIEESVSQGARLVMGGGVARDSELRHGSFFEPTLLADVGSETPVWSKELFAPVLAMQSFESLSEAIGLVNETEYGLAASLFSKSGADIDRFTREVDAGQIAINLPTTGWDPHLPFGGFKASGSAFKEQGMEGLRFYQRVKTVALAP